MLNKNDPLIGAVQEVMRRNQLERDAVKLVNEKFGIQDRKVLPHNRQHEWESAYKQILSEATDPSKYSEKQKKLAQVGNKAGLGGNPKTIDGPDLEGARKGHAKHIEESDDMGPVKAKEKPKTYKHKKSGKEISSVKHPGDEWELMKEGAVDTVGKGENEGGSAVTTIIPKPKPKPQGITPTQQDALKKKIQSIKEENLEEKAVSKVSKAQHRFFGLVRGIQKGKAHGSAKAEKAASSMSAKSVKDYAKTKEKGLPEKVSESAGAPGGMVNFMQQQARRKAAQATSQNKGSDPMNTSGGVRAGGVASRGSDPTNRASGQRAGAPTIGGARPSPSIGKNSASGTQSSTGMTIGGGRPGLVAKNSPSMPKQASTNLQIGGARPGLVAKNSPSAGPGSAQKAFDAGQAAKAKAAEPKTMGAALKAAAARGEKEATFGGKKYKVAFKDKAYQGRMEKKGAAFKSQQQVGQAQRGRPAGAPTQTQTAAKPVVPKPTARPAGVGSTGPARPTMAANAKAAGQMAISRMKAQKSAVAQTPSMSAGMSKTAPSVRKPTAFGPK